MTDGAIAKLVAAYPDFLASHDANTLTRKDGTVMILDDGKGEKDLETRLNEPDLKDMFYASYPQGRSGIPPHLDCDPGRVRHQPFFDKMYGNCQKGEVKPKLVHVGWLPQHGGGVLRVTSVNKVADRLGAVSTELDKLPDSFVKYVIRLEAKATTAELSRAPPVPARTATASPSTSTSRGRITGAIVGRPPKTTRTRIAFPGRSSRFLRSTASFGAVSGTITTLCISSTALEMLL